MALSCWAECCNEMRSLRPGFQTSLISSNRMRNHDYWVYILTNRRCSTLYIGITNNIARRLWQHRYGEIEGFAKRYHLNRLVWVEHFRNVNDAIACEKKLKGWRRARKIALIEKVNPRWLDLSDEWEQQPKLYDRPWKTEEMIWDWKPGLVDFVHRVAASLRSEWQQTFSAGDSGRYSYCNSGAMSARSSGSSGLAFTSWASFRAPSS